MNIPSKRIAAAGAVVASSLILSACGSTNLPTPTPTPSATAAAKQEDQFGLAFGTDFRADPNTEPAAVNDGDLIAISLVTEPVAIN